MQHTGYHYQPHTHTHTHPPSSPALAKHSRPPQIPPVPLPQRPPQSAGRSAPRRLRIRRIQPRIVRRIRRRNPKLHRAVALAIRTGRRAYRLTPLTTRLFTRRDIHLLQRALENLQGSERLVKRHFVAGLVDAQEGKEPRLFDLAVYNVVAGANVRKTGRGVACRVDHRGDDLPAEPVAIVVA